jgi:chromate reductase
VIGPSAGEYGALWAQDHLRRALAVAGSRVLDRDFPVGKAADRFGPNGALIDDEVRTGLVELIAAFEDHHRALAPVA